MSAPATTVGARVGDLLRPDLVGRVPYGAPQLDVPVRLNTNESSYAVPPEVVADIVAAVAEAAPALNRYPDRDVTALRGDLAAYLSRSSAVAVGPEQVWAGNGSNEVLLHVLSAYGGQGRVALGFTPTYSMHSIIAGTTGTAWVDGMRARLGGPGGGAFELPAGSAAEQVREVRPAVVFLCSPNNPTGTALALEVVEAVYDAAPDAVVVVDEAYAEFARPGTPSALTLLSGRERLVVTRTMSKAFALAGGRLGYLAADPALIDGLRLVRLPYHLATPVQVVARAALRHADVLLGAVEAIKGQRDRIVAALLDLGLDPVPSDANFVLFGGLRDERATWAALLKRGVLVRDVGLAGHLRVTAGTPAETGAFLDALRAVLAGAGSERATVEPGTVR